MYLLWMVHLSGMKYQLRGDAQLYVGRGNLYNFLDLGIADYVFTVCAHHYDATQDANNVGIGRDVSILPQTVKLIWKTYDAEGLMALF